MDDDTRLLTELMLHADIFCASIETARRTMAEKTPNKELALKISQCRGALLQLQTFYEDDKLNIRHAPTMATFRQLVMSLMWASFYAGATVDFKLFRKLLQIESGFTFLLIRQVKGDAKS